MSHELKLKYMAWTESKYHNTQAPSYEFYLETQLEESQAKEVVEKLIYIQYPEFITMKYAILYSRRFKIITILDIESSLEYDLNGKLYHDWVDIRNYVSLIQKSHYCQLVEADSLGDAMSMIPSELYL